MDPAYDVEPATGCWHVRRPRGGTGAPEIKQCGRTVAVARLLYERVVSPVPAGYVLRRTCAGGSACVNPAHREPLPRGEAARRSAMVVIDAATAAELRRLAPTMTRRELADAFGLKPATVGHVLAGRTWRGAGEPPSSLRKVKSCPLRERWAGRLPAERPVVVSARGWAALVAFVGGRSAREVGADLGMTHGAAWSLIHRTSRIVEEELARGRQRWGGTDRPPSGR